MHYKILDIFYEKMTKKGKPGISNSAKKRQLKQEEALKAARNIFAAHYRDESIGNERIDGLMEAMLKPTLNCALINPYADPTTIMNYLTENSPLTPCPGINFPCVLRAENAPNARFAAATADNTGILCAYHMDPASILTVMALDIQPDDHVLDMCAAPGGKSLCIALKLGSSGRLVANDSASERLQRVRKTFQLFLPKSMISSAFENQVISSESSDTQRVELALLFTEMKKYSPPGDAIPQLEIVSHDGTTWTGWSAENTGGFDKVLLDAPCSTERHVLAKPEELLSWGPGRNKANSVRQGALLTTALHAVKPGGTVVYSTCSLSVRENDYVVDKALRKLPFPVSIVPLKFAFGEATPLGGWHVLPDVAGGSGPIYLCKIYRHSQEPLRAGYLPSTCLSDYSSSGPAGTLPARDA